MTSLNAFKQNTSKELTLTEAVYGPCTDLFREFFKNEIPKEQFLLEFKIRKALLLRKPELKKMVEKTTKLFDGTYEKFDLSLLYFLLRNMTKIPAPVNGWGKNPDKSDTSNSASIERIKQIRNVCCHSTNGQMSDEKFKEYWKDLEQSVRNLELNFAGEYNPTYSSALALIKTGHLDCNTQELDKNEEKHDEDNEIKCTEKQEDAREMCEADIHRRFSESGTFPGLITCTKWNARSPKKKASKFIRDPHIVIIIHGVTNPCFTHEECIKSVQAYQDFHMDTNGICFIGNYNIRLPNPKALDTSKRLIKWLVESGKIPENYTLKGHRDLRPTESPGQLLYQEIQNWPHYRLTAEYQK